MKTKKIVLNGLFCALGVLLPQAFHIFGANAGRVFLPMHIPAIISGFLLGPVCGLICGVVSPVISCFAVSMPSVTQMPFMAIEIGTYGLLCGLFYEKINNRTKKNYVAVCLSLVLSQIGGRVIKLVSVLIAVYALKLESVADMVVWTPIILGVPGIAVQWFVIPAIVYAVKKRRN